MKYDKFGQAYTTSNNLCEILYQHPNIDISKFQLEDWDQYNSAVRNTHAEFVMVGEYHPYPLDYNIDVFHQTKQSIWHMPKEYSDLDIAQWLLDQCRTQEELQRVGEELILYQERNLFDLLRQLKYVIDTWRKNNVVWGVGRGSSVASYVLHIIGVHKIDSVKYNIHVHEFLR